MKNPTKLESDPYWTYTECLDAYFLDVGNRCSSRRYYKLYIYALCTSVLFSSRAHRFHLWQEISVLAGSSLRNEMCHCQKGRNDENNVSYLFFFKCSKGIYIIS
ncbi:unnamed protein product [Brassica oleracea]|uniref:(rape) hypothetical protein n=1 Tax=Brassica napus TaxID=3708 RepID=A0A816UXY8_BRANA|nr:unnamed protein product [Brassica napus]